MGVFKNIMFIFATVSLMVFVTFVRAEVRNLSQEARSVVKQQEKLQENIQVLEAEFAYLTRPARLEKIGKTLNLQTIDFNSTKPQLVSLRYSE